MWVVKNVGEGTTERVHVFNPSKNAKVIRPDEIDETVETIGEYRDGKLVKMK